jgi:exodeoxyribonuclease V alpha subunit
MRCGKPVDMHSRDCGKIVRKISDMMDNGWTGVPSQMLLRMFPNLMNYMGRLKDEYGIETEMHTVYLNYAYEVETFMAKKIKEMVNEDVDFQIAEFSYTRDDLSPEQIEAVQKSLTSKISIITGAGGSGKSSVIKELVHNLEKNGISYRIASFTGKAVSRVREVTGKKEPSTLHMMISQSKGKKKEKETFKCLIIDESSMVTTSLLYEFIQAYNFDYSIIFVGDVNQLPPISWGNFFQEILESKIVPCTVLKTIHRIDAGGDNGILINANRIIRFKNESEEGEQFDFQITKNFKIVPGDIETVKNMLTALKNNGIGADKVVVISPYNKDNDTINAICSSLHNGENRSINDWQKKLWRVGDRVICTSNNYSVNIMNGSEGVIVDLDVAQEQISVKFSADTHIFKTCAVLEDDDGTKQLNTSGLIHSFSVSVHKFQGSELDYILGYIPEGKVSSTFLNSNLLYTLITRTKKMIWLIGDVETMIRSATTKPSWRCSNLMKRLTAEV